MAWAYRAGFDRRTEEHAWRESETRFAGVGRGPRYVLVPDRRSWSLDLPHALFLHPLIAATATRRAVFATETSRKTERIAQDAGGDEQADRR